MSSNSTRRDFLKRSTGAALTLTALRHARAAGANDRIAIGLIGCGKRMCGDIMPSIRRYAKAYNVEITAVCDPWRLSREEAAGMVKDWFGQEPRQFISYRELLDKGEVDALVIASCDHQHATHLRAAAEAKKDVYCEKPLAKELEELNAAYDAVKANAVVAQVGTQLRSFASMAGARAAFQTGMLGHISRIEQCRNSDYPYWHRYVREVREEDVDWAEFLMGRPMRPFDPVRYSGWYGYREFSDGPVPQLGSHFIDLAHYITGASFPSSAVCMGHQLDWMNIHGFDCPDHVCALWNYPEGFMAHYSTNFGNSGGNTFNIFGENGTMDLQDWSNLFVSGDGALKKDQNLGERRRVEDVPRPDHIEDWLQCARERKAPNADIDAGYQHAVACLMAVRAYDTGKRQVYLPETREIREA